MVRPWVGWLCILVFISMVFYLYLSINGKYVYLKYISLFIYYCLYLCALKFKTFVAPIIRNPYVSTKNLEISKEKELQRNIYHFSPLNDKGPIISSTQVTIKAL